MNKRDEQIENRLPENPFTRTLVVPVSTTYNFTAYVKNADGLRVPKPIYPDKSPHVKVFRDRDGADKVFELSECAKCLYLYILYSLESGRDWIMLNGKPYADRTGVKARGTLAKAKEELWKAHFIEPTAIRSVYFINPAYFFAGSRSVKFHKHLQKHTDRVKDPLPDASALAHVPHKWKKKPKTV